MTQTLRNIIISHNLNRGTSRRVYTSWGNSNQSIIEQIMNVSVCAVVLMSVKELWRRRTALKESGLMCHVKRVITCFIRCVLSWGVAELSGWIAMKARTPGLNAQVKQIYMWQFKYIVIVKLTMNESWFKVSNANWMLAG